MGSEVGVDELAGLSADDVERRVREGLTNKQHNKSSRSVWTIVRANVFTLFNAIIGAAFLLLLVIGHWQDALFGFAAVANLIIGTVQEFRAKRSLDKLALLHAPQSRVRRNGIDEEITPDDIVMDDILVLHSGDQIAADAFVVDSRHVQVDESMLTGESDPVDKVPGDELLSGSVVISGTCYARVNRIGAEAYAQKFATEARRFSLVSSEIRRSLNRVLKWVSIGVGPIGLLVLNAQMIRNGGWRAAIETGTWQDAAVSTIASLESMIPMGLVLMTSISFAVGAAKLTRKNVLVNELPAVEGLARVDMICLDKTGTITDGNIAFDAPHALRGESPQGWQSVLAWIGAETSGNTTAHALADAFPVQHRLVEAATIPFSSARKWSAVSFDAPVAAGTWVMGAPEIIFPEHMGDPRNPLAQVVTEKTEQGLRTLVLARTPHVLTPQQVDDETLPPGLAAVTALTFHEKVRDDAADTIRYFREQGVDVCVISGDNPRTVASIARDVGIDVEEAFDARALPNDAGALAEVMKTQRVFGRVTPEQKKQMVLALQENGYTVAMTGDGVNDALAIKAADMGIAMNTGSAATKAVSRLVLLDGRFSRLPDVVGEGRQVIANIERVSMLFLTKTAYATGLAILAGVFVMSFPFLPRQLSVTDGLTIGIPAFFLALMSNKRRYVPGFLRRSLSFAIPVGITVAVTITSYSATARALGVSENEVRTGSTILLCIVGIWILAILSRPWNVFKIIIVAGMFVFSIVAFTFPLSTWFFQLTLPQPKIFFLIAALAVAAICVIEVIRFFHLRMVRKVNAQLINEPQK